MDHEQNRHHSSNKIALYFMQEIAPWLQRGRMKKEMCIYKDEQISVQNWHLHKIRVVAWLSWR